MAPDADALKSRIDKVSSVEAISDTLARYIIEDLKLEKDTADQVMDEAKAALGLSSATISPGTDSKGGVAPVLIHDVHAWKTGMLIGVGARPVRNLEDFVEVAEKL